MAKNNPQSDPTQQLRAFLGGVFGPFMRPGDGDVMDPDVIRKTIIDLLGGDEEKAQEFMDKFSPPE